MKIILLKDVPKIGKRHETKEVADGFALNSLIPRGLGVAATPDVIKRLSVEIAREADERKLHEELLSKTVASLDGQVISFSGKTNEKGHLFAGLHAKEIAELAHIKPEYIVLEKPLKEVGEHPIKVKINHKTATFTLSITAKK